MAGNRADIGENVIHPQRSEMFFQFIDHNIAQRLGYGANFSADNFETPSNLCCRRSDASMIQGRRQRGISRQTGDY